MPPSPSSFDDLPLTALQRRHSVKWRTHPPDVLPMFVAELDVALAPAVSGALLQAVRDGDTGYAEPAGLAEAFAGFAERRWGWQVDPSRCWPVADVMTAVGEALTALTAPGAGVVICPPVYRPFWTLLPERGRVPVPVPLDAAGGLDLPGIDAALAAGAAAVLLCSPHNPTGRVWSPAELDALDAVARPHGALVLSDEIHAPLTLPGARFTPYLQDREREAVALVSASKAFNLPGLKASLLVAGSASVADRLAAAVPPDVRHRCGHLGALAAEAAWRDGDDWLDDLLRHLDRNRTLLAELLRAHLPEVGHVPPQASYLAWLDCRALSATPAADALAHGRVALAEGTDFGPQGAGYARLNAGTTAALLTEGVRRLAVGLRTDSGA